MLIAVASSPCMNALAAKPSDAIALTPCNLPDVARPARCGVLDVPENPHRPEGRRLSISVAVIPASSGRAAADPIVPLMGGPGEEAIAAAAYFVEQLPTLLQDHDLLLVDQRGTGRSAVLSCQLYPGKNPATSLRDLFPIDAVKSCAQQLSARADLTQYTYNHFARDLEQVRRALGYGPMNLSAGSYGTRAAQVFIKAYPQSVRTVYLGSVIPMDIQTPLAMAKTAQVVLDTTLSACADEPACHAAFPNLREEFLQFIERLESGTVRVAVPGGTDKAQLHRGRVMEWFRAQVYRPKSATQLPWMIHQAHLGNWNPIVEGVLANSRGLDSALSVGIFFSITCSGDIPFLREEDIVRETRNTYLGDYRPRQQQAACREWPKIPLPADYRTPIRTSVPALFVSGDTDAATPLWYTDLVASGFSNRAQVIARGQGHTEWSDCIGQLYERFVRSGDARGLAGSTCEPVPRPPFRTR